MANIKISDLTSAASVADANQFEINEAGTSKKVTGSQIKAYVNSGDGALASKNTVATADIDNLAVTEAKLATSSVTSAKILNGTITGPDIANSTITGAKIATDTITATNIAANAVGASELNVSGNGTTAQYLRSDGDGTFTWATPTPAALSTASGSAPSYSARAWVNFKGTGTVSIRGSGNVSSITDLGSVGQYRVNFTTAMADTNYAVLATHSNYNGTNAIGGGDYTLTPACDAAATTYCNVASGDNDSNVYLDCLNLNVAVFR